AGSGGSSGGDQAAPGGGAQAAADASDAAAVVDPAETDPAKQNVAQSGGVTPAEVLGLIRWVLLGVLIAGGVAGLAGPVMMRLSARGAVSGG
ncbi:hypothetical protein NGM37_22020, partial [Streptomyces sp. TRM76130]|nr:hypothetical protein [Streptomyces sp. TRM76130]